MAIEFHWDGTSGSIQNSDKYNLLYDKPVIGGLTYEKITYSNADPQHSFKVLVSGTVQELTANDRNLLNKYVEANAVTSPWTPDEAAVAAHNVDLNSHNGIHYTVSEIAEMAHKVSTVLTTQMSLPTAAAGLDFKIPWKYIAMDVGAGASKTNNTEWLAPFSKHYDITLNMHFSGLKMPTANQLISVTIYVDGANRAQRTIQLTEDQNPSRLITIKDVWIRREGSVYIQVTFSDPVTAGAFLPYRTYLAIDSSGVTNAAKHADLMYNTLGGLVTTLGTEIYTKPDPTDPSITRVLAGAWDATRQETM